MTGAQARCSLVSVVIPAYRAQDFIAEAIASVQEQDYRPVEVVVVEDASPDDTAAVVEGLAAANSSAEFQIRLFRQPQNQGGAAALSRGFREARGEFLCWLSADDAFAATSKLSHQVAQLSAGVDLSFAPRYYSGPVFGEFTSETLVHAQWVPGRPRVERWILNHPAVRLVSMLFRNPINGSTVMMRKMTWSKLGDFDPALGNIDQDSDMWMRFTAQDARFATIDMAAGFYRIHGGQTSSRVEDCVVGASVTRIRMIMAYEECGALASLLYRAWPILYIGERRGWHRERPLVAQYLCEAGLKATKHPLVTVWLHRMQRAIEREGLAEPRLARAARDGAKAAFESPEFAEFRARLCG